MAATANVCVRRRLGFSRFYGSLVLFSALTLSGWGLLYKCWLLWMLSFMLCFSGGGGHMRMGNFFTLYCDEVMAVPLLKGFATRREG